MIKSELVLRLDVEDGRVHIDLGRWINRFSIDPYYSLKIGAALIDCGLRAIENDKGGTNERV